MEGVVRAGMDGRNGGSRSGWKVVRAGHEMC